MNSHLEKSDAPAATAREGRVQRAVSWLCRRIIKHSWRTTRENGYYIEVEQQCRICGAWRHHYFEHYRGIMNEPNWQEGRHKMSSRPTKPANAAGEPQPPAGQPKR